jgi:hypothetical protein
MRPGFMYDAVVVDDCRERIIMPDDHKGVSDPETEAKRRRELLRYAGLSSQVCASVGLALFLGIKADKWVHISFPIFSWALPLLVIVYLIIQLIKGASGKK